MTQAEILIIDDELQIRKLLEISLESNGFKVSQAASGKEGVLMAANHPPDLILLDIGLPDESGQIILSKLREWYSKPIIMLSVLSDEENIVKALDHGANDYLIKPFRSAELLARIRSALRHSEKGKDQIVLMSADLQLDLIARTVKKNHEVLKLTATEYNLLSLLAKNEGRVLTHHYLLQQVWGPAYIEQSQYLRVFVAQLRKKIEKDPNNPEMIVTESGIGYRFVMLPESL